MSQNVKKTRVRAAMAATALLAGGALLFSGASGADFTASGNGQVSVSTGNLSVELSDANNTGTFDLEFNNLRPGQSISKNFTVKNTGSIAADASIAPVANSIVLKRNGSNIPGAEAVQMANKLKVEVVGYQANVPALNMTSPLALGSLNADQSRNYTVIVSLDQSAGNEWQNVTLDFDATVTLTQKN